MTSSPRRPSPASRATRRSRRPAPRSATFLERNRNRLLWAVGGAAFLLVAVLAYLNATQPAYACTAQFDPTPAPHFVAPTAAPVASGATPAPVATAPLPGYVQPDQGHNHVAPGTRVNYTLCPPASGKHYIGEGIGPIDAGVYGPDEKTIPQGWVHNLEHGALVLLYNCGENGDPAACTDAGQAKLAALYARWPNSPICNKAPGSFNTPVFARFDDMPYPYAAMLWDIVLPMQTLDEPALLDYYARQGERTARELACVAPTPTPGPTPTAGPTATAAPTAAPTAGPTTPAATASPAPASTAP